MITLTAGTVRRILHRYRHTGEIPALAADWLRQRERIHELERQMIEAAEPFAAMVEGKAETTAVQ